MSFGWISSEICLRLWNSWWHSRSRNCSRACIPEPNEFRVWEQLRIAFRCIVQALWMSFTFSGSSASIRKVVQADVSQRAFLAETWLTVYRQTAGVSVEQAFVFLVSTCLPRGNHGWRFTARHKWLKHNPKWLVETCSGLEQYFSLQAKLTFFGVSDFLFFSLTFSKISQNL